MRLTRTPAARTGPAEWFTGHVTLEELAAPAAPARVQVVNVRFAAGARTAWHRHPLGQVIHVTEGEGRAGGRGGPLIALHPGDTVFFPPGEEHWHGAAPGSDMTHIAVQETEDGVAAVWLEHVTDAEHGAPPAPADAEGGL